PSTGNRPPSIRKNDELALLNCHRFAARLPSRALLGEQKLAPGIVSTQPVQYACGLQGKRNVAVQVLVQAVVIAGFVAEHQRGRQRLLFSAAPLQEFGEPGRESLSL